MKNIPIILFLYPFIKAAENGSIKTFKQMSPDRKDGTPAHFQVGFMGVDKMKEILFAELDK